MRHTLLIFPIAFETPSIVKTAKKRSQSDELIRPGSLLLKRKTGIEPATLALARRCSTAEPLPHIWGDRWDLNPRVPEPQSGALTPSPRPPFTVYLISALWRRRRDSNPRDACDAYTISNRAPSTRLGHFSMSLTERQLLYHKINSANKH